MAQAAWASSKSQDDVRRHDWIWRRLATTIVMRLTALENNPCAITQRDANATVVIVASYLHWLVGPLTQYLTQSR